MDLDRWFAASLAAGCGFAALGALAASRLAAPRWRIPFRLPRLPRLPWTAGRAPASGVSLWPIWAGLGLIAFGAVGLGARTMGTGPAAAGGLAALATLLVVGGLGFGLGPALRRSEQAGVATSSSRLGAVGRVTLAIPAGGVGQVAYDVDDRTGRLPARTVDGGALPEGTPILIVDIVDHLARVEPL